MCDQTTFAQPKSAMTKLRLAVSLLLSAGFLGSSACGHEYPKDAVLYSGSVGGTEVKVTASCRPFDRSAHKTTPLINRGTEDRPDWRSATVDGIDVVGTDETLPKDGTPQLSTMTIVFGTKRVQVPAKHLHHVFLPNLFPATFSSDHYVSTLIAFSADAKAVYISLGVGDGGGAGTYTLFVTDDGKIDSKPIQRPEP